MSLPYLSLLIWVPIVCGVLVWFVPAAFRRAFAMTVSLIEIFLVALVWNVTLPEQGSMQLLELSKWIPGIGVHYALGIDGISLSLVAVTVAMYPLVIFSTNIFESLKTKKESALLFSTLLLIEGSIVGSLLSLDAILFFLFWEGSVIPLFLLIGTFGGRKRIHAATKTLLYSVSGSLIVLGVFIYTAYRAWNGEGAAEPSFLISDLRNAGLSAQEQVWLGLLLGVGFGVKMPLWPFHSWVPDSYQEAPVCGAVALVLLKLGVYGFIRFLIPLYPLGYGVVGPVFAVLGVVGILYGALVAWQQADMKRVLGHSSLSHLGYCILGVGTATGAATAGSVFQLVTHGISTGVLFFLCGLLAEKYKTTSISELGGVASVLPNFARWFFLFTLTAIALPLTSAFIGEFMILVGSYAKYPSLTQAAVVGVILGAVYMLTLYLRVMWGDPRGKVAELTPSDLLKSERALLTPFFAAILMLGLFPQVLLSRIHPAVETTLADAAASPDSSDLLPSAPGDEGEDGMTSEEEDSEEGAHLVSFPHLPFSMSSGRGLVCPM